MQDDLADMLAAVEPVMRGAGIAQIELGVYDRLELPGFDQRPDIVDAPRREFTLEPHRPVAKRPSFNRQMANVLAAPD